MAKQKEMVQTDVMSSV